jgi:hypothetical protein
MWEASRMLSSGVAQRIEVDTDFDEENEVRLFKKWYISTDLIINQYIIVRAEFIY